MNRNRLLIEVMRQSGLRSILCAGSGASWQPLLLASAGFEVTVLDISQVAIYALGKRELPPEVGGGPIRRPVCVIGDLLDTSLCPGPFDVVVERLAVQVIPEVNRGAALEALAARLGRVGILQSTCLDDPFPLAWGWAQHSTGFYHASEDGFDPGIGGSGINFLTLWSSRVR